MSRIKRRSFLMGAAWGAGSVSALAREEESQELPREAAKHVDAASLIERERQRILEVMAVADIPGVAVCLIHEGKIA